MTFTSGYRACEGNRNTKRIVFAATENSADTAAFGKGALSGPEVTAPWKP